MRKLLLLLFFIVSMVTSTIGRRRYTVETELTAFCSQLAYAGGNRSVGCQSSGSAAGRVIWQENADADAHVSSEPRICVMSLLAFSEFWRKQKWRSKLYDGVKGIIVVTDSKQVEPSHELKRCIGGVRAESCQQSRVNESLALSYEPLPMPAVLLSSFSIEKATGKTIEQLKLMPNLWVNLGYSQSQIVNAGCLNRQSNMKSVIVSQYYRLATSVEVLCSDIAEISLAWTARSFSPEVKRSDRSTMIVVTSADAFSIFYNWGSGAAQLHASLSVMLAVIAWLAEMLNFHNSKLITDRDVVFVFLTSEDFGRAGSRALAAQLQNLSGSAFFTEWWGTAAAPVLANHVQSFIEIGPLGSNATATHLTVANRSGKSETGGTYMNNRSISMDELSSDTALYHLMSAAPGCDAGTLLSDQSLPLQGFTDLRIEASDEKLAAVAEVVASKIVKFLLTNSNLIPSTDQLKQRIKYMRSCFSLQANCAELFQGHFDIGDSAARNLRRWKNSGISASISYGLAYTTGAFDENVGDFAPMVVFLETMLLQLTGRKQAPDRCLSAQLNQQPTRGYPFRSIDGTLSCLSSSVISISLQPKSTDSGNAANPLRSGWVAASHSRYPIIEFYLQPKLHIELLTVAIGIVTFWWSLHVVASLLHAMASTST